MSSITLFLSFLGMHVTFTAPRPAFALLMLHKGHPQSFARNVALRLTGRDESDWNLHRTLPLSFATTGYCILQAGFQKG